MAQADAVNTGRFTDTAIDGYDAVAYFTVGKPVEGSSDYEFAWRGGNWRFANQENLDKFIAAPEMFAPQYGGWCAYAMSDQGRTVRINPQAWYIHNGKLYLNYSKSVQKKWLEDVSTAIVEADGFYPKSTDLGEWLRTEGRAK